MCNGALEVGYNTKELHQEVIYKDLRKSMALQKQNPQNIKNLIRLNLEETITGHKQGVYRNIYPVVAYPGTIVLLYEVIFNKKAQYTYKVPKFSHD